MVFGAGVSQTVIVLSEELSVVKRVVYTWTHENWGKHAGTAWFRFQVDNSTIVEVWKNNRSARNCDPTAEDDWQGFAANVVGSGNRLLVSSCWYLNYICYGEDWRRFYACDPHNFTGRLGSRAAESSLMSSPRPNRSRD